MPAPALAAGPPPPVCVRGRGVPTLLVLGCMKCGTTTLHADLSAHLCGIVTAERAGSQRRANKKEQHFFDYGSQLKGGAAAYAAQFARCPSRPRPACGAGGHAAPFIPLDSTPSYLRTPGAPSRMLRFYSALGAAAKVRLVAILRHPVARLRSHFDHVAKHAESYAALPAAERTADGWATARLVAAQRCGAALGRNASAEDGLWPPACPGAWPVAAGSYAPQLRAVLQRFRAEQLALISFAGYTHARARVLADLSRWLGVQRSAGASAAAADTGVRNSAGTRHSFGAGVRARLDRLYAPHTRAVLALLREPITAGLTTTPFAAPPAQLREAWLFLDDDALAHGAAAERVARGIRDADAARRAARAAGSAHAPPVRK